MLSGVFSMKVFAPASAAAAFARVEPGFPAEAARREQSGRGDDCPAKVAADSPQR
jgi:hypothetical protein